MNLELYHRESCPFSAKVRDFIRAEKLESKIPFFDISKDSAKKEILVKKTHDEQVPCLMVDGDPLLESDDIIEFLKMNRSEISGR